MRTTEDLMRIAGAGGGFSLDAKMRPTADLMRIAGAAMGRGLHFGIWSYVQQKTLCELLVLVVDVSSSTRCSMKPDGINNGGGSNGEAALRERS